MNDLETVLVLGGVVIIGGLAYILYTGYEDISNTINSISNIPKAVSQAIETPVLQAGADTQSKTNNYQNAQVVYTNTTSQYQTALENQIKQFQQLNSAPSIVVNPTNQVESTNGGQPATPQQLAPNSQALGSLNNPYSYANGYQGVGYYYDLNTNGSYTVQEIANLYDYNNSYLLRSSYL